VPAIIAKHIVLIFLNKQFIIICFLFTIYLYPNPKEIRVATDETWTAISENDWCMLTPANGVGSVVCVIKAVSRICIKNVMGKLLSIRKVVKVLR